jgi:hypothetical protein
MNPNDLASLSDAELDEIIASAGPPAEARATTGTWTGPEKQPARSNPRMPKTPDLSALSDSELDEIISGGVQEPVNPVIENTTDTSKPLTGTIQQAEIMNVPELFDSGPYYMRNAMNPMQGAADELGTNPLTSGLMNQAGNAQRELGALQDEYDYFTRTTGGITGDNLPTAPMNPDQVKLDALLAGGLGAIDSIDRFTPTAAIRQMLGIGPFNLRKNFTAQERVQQEMEANPNAFGIYEGMGNMAAPIPGAPAQGVAKNLAGLGGRALLDALVGGGIGAGNVMTELDQMKGVKRFRNPLTGEEQNVPEINKAGEIGAGAAGGAALGGLLGLLGHGLGYGLQEKLPQFLGGARKAHNETVSKITTATPEQQALNAQAAQSRQSLDDLLAAYPDNEELKALKAQMDANTPEPSQVALQGTVSQDVSTPPAPPVQPVDELTAALDAIKNATPETLDAALAEAHKVRGKTLQKLPTKEIRGERRKEIDTKINQAHMYYKGRDVDMSPVKGSVIVHTRTDTEKLFDQPPPKPVERPVIPPERQAEIDTDVAAQEAKLAEREADQKNYPDAYRPIMRQLESDAESLHSNGNNPYPQQFSDEELDELIERYSTELMVAEQKKRVAAKRDFSYTVKTLTTEKLRREQKKVLKGKVDESAMSDAELDEAIRKASPEEAERLSEIWERRQAASEPEAPPQPEGEFRYRTPDHLGHSKAVHEPNVDVQTLRDSEFEHLKGIPNLEPAVREIVQAKADYDYTNDLMVEYARRLIDHFAPGQKELTIPGVVKLTYDEEKTLTRAAQNEIDSLRESLSTGGEPGNAASVKGLLVDNLENRLQPLPAMPATKDINSPEAQRLFQIARAIKEAQKKAKNHYLPDPKSKTLPPGIRKKHEQTIFAANAAHEAKTGEHFLVNDTVDLNHVDLNTGELKPSGEKVRGQVEYAKAQTVHVLDEVARGKVKAAEELAKTIAGKFRMEKKGNIKLLGATGLLGSLTSQAAQAADGTVQAAAHWLSTVHGDIGGVPYSLIAAMAGFLGSAKTGVAKWVVDHDNIFSVVLFNDAMDSIGWSDRGLAAVAKNPPAQLTARQQELLPKLQGYTSLETRIREAQARTHMATFGIELDPEKTSELLRALSDGTITVSDVLANGQIVAGKNASRAQKAASILGQMSDAQRRAIVTQYAMKREIHKMATEARDIFDAFMPTDQKWKHSGAQAALNAVVDATGPKNKPGIMDKTYGSAISNFMEYQFKLNTGHHAINLTDPWIAGGVAVGTKNIAKANLMLADPEIGKLFKSSNLTTSNILDRADQAAKANAAGGFALPEIKDIPTDKINADRVALGSFLQFFDEVQAGKNPTLKGYGSELNGMSQADFVKNLLGGKSTLSPELQLRAWAHMADKGSRTLGNDLFRVNGDLLTIWGKGPAVGIFLRQPARLGRLVAQDLAAGNVGGAIKMLATTAALGGSAAIPVSAQWAWSKADPEGLNQAKDWLDEHSIGRLGITGGPKLGWDPAWIVMASANPVLGNVMDLITESPKDVDGLKKSTIAMFTNWEKDPEAAKKELPEFLDNLARMGRHLGNTVAPTILGAPTRWGVKEAQSFADYLQGKQTIYAQDTVRNPVKMGFGTKKDINLDKEGIDRRVVLGEQFVPAFTYKDQTSKALAEERDTKSHDKWVQEQAKDNGAYGAFFKDLAGQKPNRKTHYRKNGQNAPYDKDTYPSDPFAFIGSLTGGKKGK